MTDITSKDLLAFTIDLTDMCIDPLDVFKRHGYTEIYANEITIQAILYHPLMRKFTEAHMERVRMLLPIYESLGLDKAPLQMYDGILIKPANRIAVGGGLGRKFEQELTPIEFILS